MPSFLKLEALSDFRAAIAALRARADELDKRLAQALRRVGFVSTHANLLALEGLDHPQYNYSPVGKTGFPLGIENDVVLAFVNATMTFTITPVGADFTVWVEGVEYTYDAAQAVAITDTEGPWYIYFNNAGVLVAAQVIWDIAGDAAAPVCQLSWDAAGNQSIFTGYECHKYTLSGAAHDWAHYGIGTLWRDGLAVTDAGAGNLNVTAGAVEDEDIIIEIIDGAGAGLWEQDLTPVQIPIYYRLGAAGDWRRVYNVTANTYYAYEDGAGDVVWNQFVAGAWGQTAYGANAYGVYWILATGEINEPVIAVMGQGASSNQQQTAIDNNDLADFAWGNFFSEEFRVLARVLVRNAGVPYTTTAVVDFRSVNIIPSAGYVTTEHGTLAGLAADDHAQYALLVGRAGGQMLQGDTAGAGVLTLDGTSNVVKGAIALVAGNDLYTVAWYNFVGTATVGWVNDPPATLSLVYCKRVGNLCFVSFVLRGTSNAINATFTVPWASANTTVTFGGALRAAMDNGVVLATAARCYLPANSTTVSMFTDMATGVWTNVNQKYVYGDFWYEAA